MQSELIPADQLPEVRTRLVNELTGELRNGYGPILETFQLHVMAGQQAPPRREVTDPYIAARQLAEDERRRLAAASLYWVSPHMTELTRAAAPGMPPFRPTIADLPAPYGLIYFAAPFALAEETPVADLAVFSDGSTAAVPGGAFQVCAATWGPWDYQGMWPHGGTWFTFYTARPPRETDGLDEAAAAALRGLPPLRLDNECVIAAHSLSSGAENDEIADLVQQGTGTITWVHLLLCAFRLMATSRTASVSPWRPMRAVRRRAARAQVDRPDEPVQLVDVTARPRSERGQSAGESGRSYRVRWLVEGHWRRQWYPASGVHRPRYIDTYVKGPEDAPLQLKEKVHVWREPAGEEPAP